MPPSRLPTVSLTVVRRMAVARQRLAGSRVPSPSPDEVLDVARDLGCLQLDPIAVVARSHLLVLWSRLGPFDREALEVLQWRERQLFEYFAHAASLVLTEDFQIHHAHMRRFARGDTTWSRRVRTWLEENRDLRRHILRRLRAEGPLRSRDFEDRSRIGWQSSGWTAERNVSRMLDFLWAAGTITVAGRSGLTRWWDLSERWFPDWTPRRALPGPEVVRRAAQRSLRALGIARPRHIGQHFIRGSYPGLASALSALEREKQVSRVLVAEDPRPSEPWYVHQEDLSLLERLLAGKWEECEPRTTLLSPFDNLICDRSRTEELFGFRFRLEIYVPRSQRRYGYYVMPILWRDRLVGRIDPVMDRRRGRLVINAVHIDPGPAMPASVGREVAGTIRELARFLGASETDFSADVPAEWRRQLR
ncbi:MAG: winged helix-turn-helix domain-containing protein [Actinobacteria bacterium]|nr:winged helix-turn-helix domain-containing protein [Actinomycetota bacterium]